jgi:hypothetical protein
MFGKYKEASVKKKLPRIARLGKIQNLNSNQGSHESNLLDNLTIDRFIGHWAIEYISTVDRGFDL